MTGYEKLKEKALPCLEKSKDLKKAVNKDAAYSVGRKLCLVMCGKAVKDEIMGLFKIGHTFQLCILDPVLDWGERGSSVADR